LKNSDFSIANGISNFEWENFRGTTADLDKRVNGTKNKHEKSLIDEQLHNRTTDDVRDIRVSTFLTIFFAINLMVSALVLSLTPISLILSRTIPIPLRILGGIDVGGWGINTLVGSIMCACALNKYHHRLTREQLKFLKTEWLKQIKTELEDALNRKDFDASKKLATVLNAHMYGPEFLCTDGQGDNIELNELNNKK